VTPAAARRAVSISCDEAAGEAAGAMVTALRRSGFEGDQTFSRGQEPVR
jgi:hypothetical protein